MHLAEYILCNLFVTSCHVSSRTCIPCNCMQIISLHSMLRILISWKVSLQVTVQMTFHSGFNPKPIEVKRKKLISRLQWPQSPILLYWQKRNCSYSQIRLLTQFNFFFKCWLKCLYILPIIYPWITWNSLLSGGKYFQQINDAPFQLL